MAKSAIVRKSTDSPRLFPIDHASMQNMVYDSVTAYLMKGGFEPGHKVSSRKLAAQLGTSDMPVRAALGRLLAENALVQSERGTISVPKIDRKTFVEVMELRALLEARATNLACGRVDLKGFAELRQHSDSLDRAIASNSIDDYLDANQRLKFAIYRYCDDETLKHHIHLLWLRAGPFMRHLNRGLQEMIHANFHEEAIAALACGDAPLAAAAIANDIRAGLKFLCKNCTFEND